MATLAFTSGCDIPSTIEAFKTNYPLLVPLAKLSVAFPVSFHSINGLRHLVSLTRFISTSTTFIIFSFPTTSFICNYKLYFYVYNSIGMPLLKVLTMNHVIWVLRLSWVPLLWPLSLLLLFKYSMFRNSKFTTHTPPSTDYYYRLFQISYYSVSRYGM